MAARERENLASFPLPFFSRCFKGDAMLKIDHGFYTLPEALKLVGCKMTDFLKLGAAGKIDLYAWVCRDHLVEEKGDECVELDSAEASLLALHKNDIMGLYLNMDKNKINRVTTFKGDKGEYLYVPGAAFYSLSMNDIFIMGDTLRGDELAPFRKLESNNVNKENFPFVDKKHDYFCPHLAVAVEVWLHLYDKRNIKVNSIGQPIKKTFGQQAADYLKEHYPELKGNAFERVISISNPNPNAKAVIEDD